MEHGENRNNRMICHAKPREISVWYAKNSESLQDVQPAWSGFLEQTYKETYCKHCGVWVKCMGISGALKWVAVHGDGQCIKKKTSQKRLEIT
mgnify:FL=1